MSFLQPFVDLYNWCKLYNIYTTVWQCTWHKFDGNSPQLNSSNDIIQVFAKLSHFFTKKFPLCLNRIYYWNFRIFYCYGLKIMNAIFEKNKEVAKTCRHMKTCWFIDVEVIQRWHGENWRNLTQCREHRIQLHTLHLSWLVSVTSWLRVPRGYTYYTIFTVGTARAACTVGHVLADLVISDWWRYCKSSMWRKI